MFDTSIVALINIEQYWGNIDREILILQNISDRKRWELLRATLNHLIMNSLTPGDDDDEEDSAKKEERERKRQEEDESLFHRLEESRLMLEQELGFDKFLRVYKYLQVQKFPCLF